MYKAYDAIEAQRLDVGMVDEELFAREKALAREFVRRRHVDFTADKCVVCKSVKLYNFGAIENIPYVRCGDCGSVFIPLASDITREYREWGPIVELKNTENYQNSALERRSMMWEELLFWISFRSRRFLGGGNYDILDFGNQYAALSEMIRDGEICGRYRRRSSVLENYGDEGEDPADIVLFLDSLPCHARPDEALTEVREKLKPGGLLFLSLRVGSGFDILTLKTGNKRIFPYAHTVLPTVGGLNNLLGDLGYNVLEVLTPGALDVKYVKENIGFLDSGNMFVRYLLENADIKTLSDFQGFLQKSGMSSHARIIAEKEK